ncbi:tRNA (adenosine(37)-N6)-dimethylallyltransferase MiaA [Paenibacillus validus]|uniref:tRNA (adenosine(37)-N6)-dimethylallyltransferase MiaA n=1 Tax=Paenibacillus validus TaxID=44253 RepID=UPI000FDAEA42|nr:tRNA (adenosine(37)-N6)-dimethylallyltransferase MiaA [Paenibacillus validus]MED4603485.1 tRNA (adenosine(37)-N6)-dimethylallyltransferase MiaA [Paenibacillus validus]MED4609672.1 tRNA (adenosine(37)-N6)-dimethylallyltransferase MiaA [Paenibacillus validus]
MFVERDGTNPAPARKPKLLVLVGPTAVGKTKLSLTLAQMYDAEIISGDSMQVYRRMDIGTAKATPEERAMVKHHLIDIHEPEEPFSVAEFQERCVPLIRDIDRRGKLPFIVGGTGLYIESVCYDFQFSEARSDEAFREEMETFALRHGADALHARLREVDPESAERLHPNDQRRIIRALEIYKVTGERLSDRLKVQKRVTPYELCIIGLTMDRALLYKRIEERIDLMIEQGLVDEVRGLLAQGVDPSSLSMQGLGYKEIVSYLEGRATLNEAIDVLKKNTRHFAKRQLSWFRRMKDIEWVDMSQMGEFSTQLQFVRGIIATKLTLTR